MEAQPEMVSDGDIPWIETKVPHSNEGVVATR